MVDVLLSGVAVQWFTVVISSFIRSFIHSLTVYHGPGTDCARSWDTEMIPPWFLEEPMAPQGDLATHLTPGATEHRIQV